MDFLLGISIVFIGIGLCKALESIEALESKVKDIKAAQTQSIHIKQISDLHKRVAELEEGKQINFDDLLIANYLTEQSRACDNELARSMRNVATHLYRKYEKTT